MNGSSLARRRLVVMATASLSWTVATLAPLDTSAQVAEPASRVRAFYDALLDVMKRGRDLGIKGRYDQLAPVIARTFDVAGMTRFACGPGWEQTTPAQRQALIEAFGRMMTATYANRFAAFNGEKFEVGATVDQPPGKLVKTRLTPSRGDVVELDYVMRSTSEGWKVADVFLNGSVSELGIRRGEFVSVLRSGGPDALVQALRKKAEQFLAGG
jgi:phospholipid transport system substrate-binding protein